jgi:peptidoglycan/LPS O-acetylase OafA/YrhL
LAPKYRSEIDGLRALAVIPVIFYHAGFAAVSGGFLGVDVFFVISGYLIAGIIHHEIQQGSFSIIRFYERRVRRILPALYVVVLACTPFAWMWLLPVELKDFAKSAISVVLFVSNVFFYGEIGYFSHNTDTIPLIHTWSLGVEEQFYAIFPMFLLLLARLKIRRLLAPMIVLTIASLCISEWMTRVNPKLDFYLLPTRCWELGVGAIVSSIPWDRLTIGNWAAETASAVGLIALTYSLFAFDQTMPLPGLLSLVPIGGTALLIAFATPGTVCGRALAFKPLVGVGLISYSAYLWHQPLFAFARIRYDAGSSSITMFALCLAVLGLAYVSWQFVERPFRDTQRFSRRFVFAGAMAVGAAFIVAGRETNMGKGFPARWPIELADATGFGGKPDPQSLSCMGDDKALILPEKSCVFGVSSEPRIAIWGDSHALAIAKELGEKLGLHNQAARVLTLAGCPPARGIRLTNQHSQSCPKYNDLVFSYLVAHPDIATVVITARWPAYTDGPSYDNGEGGVVHERPYLALPLSDDDAFVADPNRIDEVGSIFRSQIVALLKMGRNVVLVYPVPEIGWEVPQRLAQETVFQHHAEREPISVNFEYFRRRSQNAVEQLDRLPEAPTLLRIRPEEVFCNTAVVGRCTAEMDARALYIDDNHLNSDGAAILARQIVEAMNRKGWL